MSQKNVQGFISQRVYGWVWRLNVPSHCVASELREKYSVGGGGTNIDGDTHHCSSPGGVLTRQI